MTPLAVISSQRAAPANAIYTMEEANGGANSADGQSEDFDHAMRFAILGSPNAGKTAFRMRAVDNIFLDAYIPTTGLETASRVCEASSGSAGRGGKRSGSGGSSSQLVLLHFADGPGDVPDGRLRSMIKHADGYFVMFSVTDRASFEAVEAKVSKAYSIVQRPLRLILVGNKIDLGEQRCVTEAEGTELAVKIGAEIYFETSCKSGEGIEEVLTFMERLVINKVELQQVWRDEPSQESTDGGDTPASQTPIEPSTPSSSSYVHSKAFADVLQRMEHITERRHQLLRAVTEGFESDATRQQILDQCIEQLTNGIEVTKYHRRSRGRAQRWFWFDPDIEQLCYGRFGQQAGIEHKGIRISDIAEIRVGADAFVFQNCRRGPPSEKDATCVSIIGSHRTLDIQLPRDCANLIPGIKLLADRTIRDDLKKQRGKAPWQKAKFLTRRQGRLTLADIGTLEAFKKLLVRGMMVRHHVVHRIAIEKQLWLEETTGRLIIAPTRTSVGQLRQSMLLIDIAEIRAGRDSYVFANEQYLRDVVQPEMCATIIGSECTIDLSFVSELARNLFVQKIQTMLRLIRPELVTY